MKILRQVLFLIITTLFIAGCKDPASVLLVTGGHGFDTLEFFQLFSAMDDYEFDSVSHPDALELLASERAESYDLIIFYDFIPDMEQKDSIIFLNLAQKGQSMLFLHHSLCSFQKWDGYEKLVGGKYVMPAFSEDTASFSDYRHDIDLAVEILDPSHPVTRGIENFSIHDEGYSNIRTNDNIQPLFGTTHNDCSPLVGWVNRFDQSTCIYLMFGHDKQAYTNDSFNEILKNSINWLSTL